MYVVAEYWTPASLLMDCWGTLNAEARVSAGDQCNSRHISQQSSGAAAAAGATSSVNCHVSDIADGVVIIALGVAVGIDSWVTCAIFRCD